MPPTAKTGTGTTITAASVAFTMKIIGVDPFAIALDDIEASNMASATYKEFIPADLADLGELSIEVEYDASFDILNLLGVAQTWTIDPGGRGAGHKIIGTGYLKGFTAGLPLNDKATGTVTVKWDGDTFDVAQS